MGPRLAWTVVAAGLLSSSPAAAHCYRVWHYPRPQGCVAAAKTTQPEDHNWYVEITAMPDERAEGVAKLKALLNGATPWTPPPPTLKTIPSPSQ